MIIVQILSDHLRVLLVSCTHVCPTQLIRKEVSNDACTECLSHSAQLLLSVPASSAVGSWLIICYCTSSKEQPNYHSEVPLSKSMTSLQSAFQLAALLPAASQLFSTPALFDRDDPSA